VTFGFNPNLAAGSDMGLEFRVTGGVSRVGLNYNGTGTGFVNEVVCTVFMPTGICPAANTLALINVNAADENESASFTSANTIWIFKDLNSGNSPFSEVIQTFQTTTPEPTNFLLMGAGLLGLGILRRGRHISR
jgi:PEP-CTERM motif